VGHGVTLDLTDLRVAIADRVAPVIRSYDHVPDKPEPPCFIAYPGDSFVTFDTEAAQQCTVSFRGLVLTRSTSARSGQHDLDGYMLAVADELERQTDDRLGDVADFVVVREVSPVGTVELDDAGQTRAYVGEVTFQIGVAR
jgi:hypothetical protein